MAGRVRVGRGHEGVVTEVAARFARGGRGGVGCGDAAGAEARVMGVDVVRGRQDGRDGGVVRGVPVRGVMRGRLSGRGCAATAAVPPATGSGRGARPPGLPVGEPLRDRFLARVAGAPRDGAAQRRRGGPQLGEGLLRADRVVLDPPVVDDGPVRRHPIDAQPVGVGDVGPRDQGRSDGDGGGALARAAQRVAVGAARGPGGGFAHREPARPDGADLQPRPGLAAAVLALEPAVDRTACGLPAKVGGQQQLGRGPAPAAGRV